MEQGSISIYIDEINMHHKIRLRDDERIDAVLFFEDQLTMVAHLKQNTGKDNVEEDKNHESDEDSSSEEEDKRRSKKKTIDKKLEKKLMRLKKGE
jgi:hypothetical protein